MSVLSILALFWFASAQTQVQPSYLWAVSDRVQNPESVYYDTESNLIFVSNIVGEGTAKDGKGWIQKISASGKMLNSGWVSGLNAPKGMRAFKGKLWVTDIDTVLAIEIKSGKILQKISIPKAQFLNDVAIHQDGTVYVTDTIGRTIYILRGNSYEVFLDGDSTESPNGLLIQGDRLIVASWGLAEKDWSAKVPGNIYSVDLKTKKKTMITKNPLGNLDGLEFSQKGEYLVSDWMAGKVYAVKPDGQVQTLSIRVEQGMADIGYIPKTNTLLIPFMKGTEVIAYDLDKILPTPAK